MTNWFGDGDVKDWYAAHRRDISPTALDPSVVLRVSRLLGENNGRDNPGYLEHIDRALVHINMHFVLKRSSGDTLDRDSGEDHLIHAVARLFLAIADHEGLWEEPLPGATGGD